MSDAVVVRLPRVVVERLRLEAERLGLSFEEYMLELLSRDLDPRDKAVEYIEVAVELLEEAREELERGNVRQAAEKLWGAAALAVKAYAYWKEGRRLTSHSELWEYKSKVAEDIGKWVYSSWNAGQAMHTCFYEGWCRRDDVENALEEVEKLVKTVEEKIRGRG